MIQQIREIFLTSMVLISFEYAYIQRCSSTACRTRCINFNYKLFLYVFQLSEAQQDLHDTSATHLAESEHSMSQSELTKAELDERDVTIADMKKIVDALEVELQTSVHRENDLRKVLLARSV